GGRVEREAVDAVAVEGGRDVEVHALVQGDRAHRREHGAIDDGLVLPGDRLLTPRAVADGVHLPAGVAVGAAGGRHLQVEPGRGDGTGADPAHVDAKERALDGARVRGEDLARA